MSKTLCAYALLLYYIFYVPESKVCHFAKGNALNCKVRSHVV